MMKNHSLYPGQIYYFYLLDYRQHKKWGMQSDSEFYPQMSGDYWYRESCNIIIFHVLISFKLMSICNFWWHQIRFLFYQCYLYILDKVLWEICSYKFILLSHEMNLNFLNGFYEAKSFLFLLLFSSFIFCYFYIQCGSMFTFSKPGWP